MAELFSQGHVTHDQLRIKKCVHKSRCILYCNFVALNFAFLTSKHQWTVYEASFVRTGKVQCVMRHIVTGNLFQGVFPILFLSLLSLLPHLLFFPFLFPFTFQSSPAISSQTGYGAKLRPHTHLWCTSSPVNASPSGYKCCSISVEPNLKIM